MNVSRLIHGAQNRLDKRRRYNRLVNEILGMSERDVADMLSAILAEPREAPFDILHAQYGYPNGWAVLLAARELGIPAVRSGPGLRGRRRSRRAAPCGARREAFGLWPVARPRRASAPFQSALARADTAR